MKEEEKIKKWMNGELSDSEKREFEGTEAYSKISRLLKAVNNFKAPEYDVDKEYRRLTEYFIENKKPVFLYHKLTPILKIAAVFIFALLIGYFIYDHFNAETINQDWIADQTELYLPDSSFVSLNADSRIRISNSNWENERNIELQGEAFFRVKEGSQFNVITKQGTVTVLGTEFGVKDWVDYYEVSCYTGLVQVVTAENSIILQSNSAFRIINNKEENYSFSNESEPAWLKGESSFKSVPLKFVLNELERQYNVTIKTQNIDLVQLFSGNFSHQNLEIALESITFPLNLDYKINGNKIVITFEGK